MHRRKAIASKNSRLLIVGLLFLMILLVVLAAGIRGINNQYAHHNSFSVTGVSSHIALAINTMTTEGQDTISINTTTAHSTADNVVQTKTHQTESAASVQITAESTSENNSGEQTTSLSIKTESQVTAEQPQSTLAFIKGGHGIEGDLVHISLLLNRPVSGNCHFHFYLNGTLRPTENARVYSATKRVADGRRCELYVPIVDLPGPEYLGIDDLADDGRYVLDLFFTSDNGQETAKAGYILIDTLEGSTSSSPR